MAKLTNCSECNQEISPKAKSCPSCGHPVKPKTSGCLKIFVFLMILGFVGNLLPQPEVTPEQRKAQQEVKQNAQKKKVKEEAEAKKKAEQEKKQEALIIKQRLEDVVRFKTKIKEQVKYVVDVKLLDEKQEPLYVYVTDDFIRQDKLFKKREYQGLLSLWKKIRKGFQVTSFGITIKDRYGEDVVTSTLFSGVEVKQ